MKHTTNTQPLYKVLNEQRTQGEWETPDNTIWSGQDEIGKFLYHGNSANKANAQYTALAVNNLHHLAEALEALTKWVIHNTDATPTALINAREALSRIS